MTDKPQQPEDQQAASHTDPESADGSAKGGASAGESEAASSATVGGKKQAKDQAASVAKTDRRSPAKKAANWSAFFLVLILLASIGGLTYFQWLHQQDFEETIARISEQVEQQSSQLSDVSQSIAGVQREVEQARQGMSQLSEQRQQQARQLEQRVEQRTRQLEQQVSGLRQQVQAISTTTTEDWKLAEAYYLTRLAGQRLLMERDTQSAMALLRAADDIVSNYPDPDLHPVRQALSDDIAALRLADSVDRQGLYLRIGALSRQIDELQVTEPLNYQAQEEAGPTAEQAQADSETGGIWHSIQQSFARAMAKLEDFIRVSRHEEAIQPLISRDQQLYLRSSLQATLDTAQLALFREQPHVYQASLEKAQNLLARLYRESARRAALMNELEGLANTNIVQDLPDISDSQQALGNYLEQRHQLAPQIGPARDQEQEDQQ